MKTRFEVGAPVLKEELEKPYVFGQSDCFLLGCRMADVFDPSRRMAEKYTGAYRTLRGAQKALVRLGYKSLPELLAAHLEPCAPARARFGDLAVVNLPDGQHVAVCTGDSYLTKTPHGKSHHAVHEVIAAFRT